MKNSSKIGSSEFGGTPSEKGRRFGKRAIAKAAASVAGLAIAGGAAHVAHEAISSNPAQRPNVAASAPQFSNDATREQMMQTLAKDVMSNPAHATVEVPNGVGGEHYVTTLSEESTAQAPIMFTVVTNTNKPNSVTQVSESVQPGIMGGQPGEIDFTIPGVAPGEKAPDWTVSTVSGDGYGGSFETNIVNNQVVTTDTLEPHAKPVIEAQTPTQEFAQDASQVLTDLNPSAELPPPGEVQA